jgi:hypothetical protein
VGAAGADAPLALYDWLRDVQIVVDTGYHDTTFGYARSLLTCRSSSPLHWIHTHRQIC